MLDLVDAVLSHLVRTFLSLGSPFSAASLLCALMVAMYFLLRRHHRPVRPRVMLRALFPRWYYRNASFRTDIFFMVWSLFLNGLLFGWVLFTAGMISSATSTALTEHFGAAPRSGMSDFALKSIMTIVLFLAYEVGYWMQHYLMHRVPFLWEFHKVHHTAQVLSPMTNFRVHPIDTLIFNHALALTIGAASGLLSYGLGPVSIFSLNGRNVIILAAAFLLIHLQHTQVWIPATGTLGRIIMSPAHHQCHHSDDPRHFDKNFGSCLAVWDWMAGTLHIPTLKRERIKYGVNPKTPAQHTVIGSMLGPLLGLYRLYKRPNARFVQSKPLAPVGSDKVKD